MKKIAWIIGIVCSSNAFAQGDFPPAAGETFSTAIHREDTRIERWATACEVFRGPQDISNTSSEDASFGTVASAVGASSPLVLSLGDGGEAVLTFDTPISNVVGFDFAIFENSFSDTFLELAFVEVSSDGENFFRFPSVSLTPTAAQVGPFGSVDPTGIYNLAGKYRAQYGTPFELEEMKSIDGLDINAITHIKIIDVIGAITGDHISYDSQGNMINDPWPTPFESSGFDLDAIAVLKGATVGVDELLIDVKLYPNPATDQLVFERSIATEEWIHIYDLSGRTVVMKRLNSKQSYMDVSKLKHGIYFMQYKSQTLRFIKE